MPDWRMNDPYFKRCNCEPGCPCDFLRPPTYQDCESVLGMRVDEGEFACVSLDGIKWAVAYHWPGPLHEGNGTVKPYFDEAMSQEQIDALGQILMGQAGGSWFEVVATIVSEVKEPAVVPIDFEVSGKTGAIKIGEGIENRFEPLLNPVTGAEESVQIHIPGGLEYSEGEGAA